MPLAPTRMAGEAMRRPPKSSREGTIPRLNERSESCDGASGMGAQWECLTNFVTHQGRGQRRNL